MFRDTVAVQRQTVAGKYLIYTFKYPFSVTFGRTQGEYFTETLSVQFWCHTGIGKKPFDLRGEYERAVSPGIEEWFDPQTVPAQAEAVFMGIPERYGKNSV